jgi:hypothetical protein
MRIVLVTARIFLIREYPFCCRSINSSYDPTNFSGIDLGKRGQNYSGWVILVLLMLS